MASAPYIPLPSLMGSGDTRPDTSGHFPGVHYNIPLYGPQGGSAGLDPFGHYVAGPIAKTIATTLQQDFNPLTSQGIANIAGIMVPGGMKGEPTLGQQQFLNSIRGSSLGETGGLHYPEDQSVLNLRQKIGEPFHSYAPGGYVAHNPVEWIPADSPGAGQTIGRGHTPAGTFHDYGVERNEAWSHFINYLDKLKGTGDYSVQHGNQYTKITNMNTGRSGYYDTVTGEFAHDAPDRANVDVLAGFNPSGLNQAGISGSQATRDALLAYLKLAQGHMREGSAGN